MKSRSKVFRFTMVFICSAHDEINIGFQESWRKQRKMLRFISPNMQTILKFDMRYKKAISHLFVTKLATSPRKYIVKAQETWLIIMHIRLYPKLTVIDRRWMRAAGKSECVPKRTKRVNACFADRESREWFGRVQGGFHAHSGSKPTIALLFFSLTLVEHAKIVIRILHRCARHSRRLSSRLTCRLGDNFSKREHEEAG